MKIIFTAILFVFSFVSYAQRCATVEYNQKNIYPQDYLSNQKGSHNFGRDTLANEVIVVPVVIHLLYHSNSDNLSDERIMSQINALNNDYRRRNDDTINTPEPFKHLAADTRIVFCLAKVDPNGYATSGIIRKYTKEEFFLADDQMKFSSKGGDDAWDPSKYLNIWVCNLFGRTLGYATLPGSPAAIDGIVIKNAVFGYENGTSAPYNKGRTLTHESGHWLGLQHIWGDKLCGDDGIDDTPPQKSSNNGCPQFPATSDCSINQYGDMFMNYMDFTDDGCMNMFTIGQKNKMRSMFAKNGLRNSFLDNDLCDGSDAVAAPTVNPKQPLGIKIYPNPTVTNISITGSLDEVNGRTLRIYNIQGKLLFSKVLQSQTTTIPMNNLSAGLYMVIFEGAEKNEVFKIVKSN